MTLWLGDRSEFSERPSATFNNDGTTALSRSELAERLLEIAAEGDDGEPKTGRRYWYLALSLGYVRPSMEAGEAAAKERKKAQKRITDILGILRKQGRLDWDMVLDLTRELDEWQTFESVRDARAYMRRIYTEDLWLGQPCYPILIVEKDTMEPVCKPMARAWQIPFASSRGYGSLKLQHDVAAMVRKRFARTGQRAIVFFISDLDPSGIDLQRSWEQAMDDFNVPVSFVRLGLTMEQVRDPDLKLDRLAVAVKPSDSRSKQFIEQYGSRCWETDVLPAATIRDALDTAIHSLLDRQAWLRRGREIDAARALL
jgi:hypothetical protein